MEMYPNMLSYPSLPTKAIRQFTTVVHFVTVATLLVTTAYQSMRFFLSYVDEPTYMAQAIVPQLEANFPSVTICTMPCSEGTEVACNKTASTSATNFLVDLYLRFFFTDKFSLRHNKLYKPTEYDTRLIRREFDEDRPCFTLHLNGEHIHRNNGLYYLRIGFTEPIELFIHKSGSFLEAARRIGLKARLGIRTEAQVMYEDVSRLRRREGFTGWTRTPSNPIEDLWTCSQEEFDQCFQRNRTNISRCSNTCSFLELHVSARNYEPYNPPNRGRAYIYFPQRVISRTEHYLYGFLELASDLGGVAGLLLGVSIFDIVHMIKDWAFRRI